MAIITLNINHDYNSEFKEFLTDIVGFESLQFDIIENIENKVGLNKYKQLDQFIIKTAGSTEAKEFEFWLGYQFCHFLITKYGIDPTWLF